MPRKQTANGRVKLRLRAEDKATLPRAQAPIAEAEKLKLSERDSLRVLDLLENPPAPPLRLRRAAEAGCILE